MNINACFSDARAGVEGAKEQLFQSLSERFCFVAHQRLGNECDAQDLAQNALLAVSAHYESLEVTSSFAAWAFKVLDNEILGYYRKKGRQESGQKEFVQTEAARNPHNPNPLLRTRLLDCFRRVIRASQRYARVLNLHYQGFSTEDICVRLELSENASYVLLFRARALLQDCLDE